MNHLVALVSNTSQLAICELHVVQYRGMLDSGNPNFRVDECADYLRIWTEGARCLRAGLPMPDECVDELVDYLDSGEEQGLTEAEFKAIDAITLTGEANRTITDEWEGEVVEFGNDTSSLCVFCKCDLNHCSCSEEHEP
jgi:hypothetical protein